jgi:hypothetical protein
MLIELIIAKLILDITAEGQKNSEAYRQADGIDGCKELASKQIANSRFPVVL